MLTHKGYAGTIECDLQAGYLHGRVQGIADCVIYEGQTVDELKQAFIDAVDGYLELCDELGKSPEKPFKGSFNVCIDSDLHRRAYLASRGSSLNAFVGEAIREKLARM